MTRSAFLTLPLLVPAAACAVADVGEPQEARTIVEHIDPRSPADGDVPPFSGAVRVDNTLHLSRTPAVRG